MLSKAGEPAPDTCALDAYISDGEGVVRNNNKITKISEKFSIYLFILHLII